MSITLEARGLSKWYVRAAERTLVLDDVNLSIEQGEFISIVGASGCGKTTLLRILHGLLDASAGEVLHDGQPVTGPSRRLGLVFQQDSLLPWRTVLRNVELGPELGRASRKAYRPTARSLLQLVGLEGFDNHYPHELSGGMRQRVNLARALASDPDVLLMDEPFAALDAQTREVMQAELLRIWRDAHKTVVFVTHQIDEAVYLSDRVVVLSARPGRVREIVPIELPRPRELDVKRTQEFADYAYRLWKMIEEEAKEGVRLESQQADQGRGRPSRSRR